jgi:hypothetical protein
LIYQEKGKEADMMQHIYMAVFAIVEDGKITGYAMDSEALVGSYDGFVWNADTEEWSNESIPAESEAWVAVNDALGTINTAKEE